VKKSRVKISDRLHDQMVMALARQAAAIELTAMAVRRTAIIEAVGIEVLRDVEAGGPQHRAEVLEMLSRDLPAAPVIDAEVITRGADKMPGAMTRARRGRAKHWTQRPENARKLRRMTLQAARTRAAQSKATAALHSRRDS